MHEGPANGLPASTEMLAAEYLRMANVESRHWWYTSLHADVLDLIRAHFGANRAIRVLDAGCGTGGLLRYLRSHGLTDCKGLDISPLAVDYCRQQGLDVRPGSIADAAALAVGGKADVIVSLDVICSLPDARQRADFLRAAMAGLNDGGLLLVQTPAFRCLGGIHDLAVGVNHRYTKAELHELLAQAGIRHPALRYRLVLLTPLVLLARSLQRLRLRLGGRVRIESDISLPPALLNRLLFHLQRSEDRWLRWRPFGTSLQILARKDAEQA